jgi:hypothetical protein
MKGQLEIGLPFLFSSVQHLLKRKHQQSNIARDRCQAMNDAQPLGNLPLRKVLIDKHQSAQGSHHKDADA